MALYLGDKKISKLYLGDTECNKAYLGDTLVFGDSIPKMQWIKTTLPDSHTLRLLCFANDRFICIPATSKKVLYSYDGINWNTYSNDMVRPYTLSWSSIAFDGDKTVVVFSSNGSGVDAVNYSLDKGVNWNKATLPSKDNIRASAYGNGRFIALGTKGTKRFYSTDGGVTWGSANSGSASIWEGMVYGNGKFVAVSGGVGGSSKRSYYSEDGVSFKSYDLPQSTSWIDVTYGDGKFVAIAYKSNVGAYSLDGKTWTQITLPSVQYWKSVTYGSGKFFAVSGEQYGSETSAYSEDGINWTELKLPEVRRWCNIKYGLEKFVAISGYNNVSDTTAYLIPDSFQNIPTKTYTVTVSVYPPDSGTITGGGSYTEGTQVTLLVTPADGYMFTGLEENGKVVSTSEKYTFTINSNKVFVSSFAKKDIKWIASVMPADKYWKYIAYGNEKFVAIPNEIGGTYAAYSSDGINWNPSTLPSNSQSNWEKITYGNGKFVVCGGGLAYSTDGINWNSVPDSPPTVELVTYGDGKFVGLYRNIGYYSEDGVNWNSSNLPIDGNYACMAYGNGKYIALDYMSSSYIYSDDGISWSIGSLPSSGYFPDMAYGDGTFIALKGASTNEFLFSIDGINWDTGTFPQEANWNAICYGNGKFVAIAGSTTSGTHDQCVWSSDGVNWESTTLPSSAYWSSMAYGNGKFVAIAWDSNKTAYLFL